MDVVETIGRAKREVVVSAGEADATIALYEGDSWARNYYDVRRHWDQVSFCVAVSVKGEPLPFLSYLVSLND